MSTSHDPARHSVHAALSVASRVEILARLRESAEPLDVDELAGMLGLHRNTVRFHINSLIEARLATSTTVASGRRGRPRHVYRAAAEHPGHEESGYRILAETLTAYLAHRSVAPEAEGREAGRLLAQTVDNPFGSRRTSAAATARFVDATFTELGFGSTLTRERGGYRLSLRYCPFRDLAARHPDVVCGMHAGLLEQSVSGIESPIEEVSLTPFVEPRLCLARLATSRPEGRTGP